MGSEVLDCMTRSVVCRLSVSPADVTPEETQSKLGGPVIYIGSKLLESLAVQESSKNVK